MDPGARTKGPLTSGAEGPPFSRVEPRSALGRAFTYVNNQRDALSRFLDDARLAQVLDVVRAC
jgi:hypothetical protein